MMIAVVWLSRWTWWIGIYRINYLPNMCLSIIVHLVCHLIFICIISKVTIIIDVLYSNPCTHYILRCMLMMVMQYLCNCNYGKVACRPWEKFTHVSSINIFIDIKKYIFFNHNARTWLHTLNNFSVTFHIKKVYFSEITLLYASWIKFGLLLLYFSSEPIHF